MNTIQTLPGNPERDLLCHLPTASTSRKFKTGGVLLLSLCHLVHDIYSNFLSPLLPLLIEKLSMSLTQAGLLSTVMQLPALLNPIIGVWADRISVRWFIILAPTLTAVPMSLIGTTPNYAVLILLLFFTGISVSIFHVPAPVMIAKLSGDRKGRGMSFFMTGGELVRALKISSPKCVRLLSDLLVEYRFFSPLSPTRCGSYLDLNTQSFFTIL